MRAITVRQPWPWTIAHGQKDVENRTRNIAGGYRGAVAIHAGLTVASLPEYTMVHDLLGREKWGEYAGGGVMLGAIIGVVDLVAVHHANTCFENPSGACSPWAQPNQHHLTLANPRPLAHPIPAKGRLGLWIPGGALQDAIWEQVAA